MENATLKQAGKIISLFSETDEEQVQEILESGFLADLRDAKNVKKINRNDFRKLCGLPTLGLPLFGRFIGTVKRGIHKTPDAFRQAGEAKGKRKIGMYADQILEKITPSSTEEEVDLWEVTGAELGFSQTAKRKDIYARAFKAGFAKCASEDGLLFWLICEDGIYRVFEMDPLEDSDGDFRLFLVDSDGFDLWLNTDCDYPGFLWDPGVRWVFVWPRRK